ncbi:glycosyltransferase family 2 protein [Arthrobacter sp. NPDC056691]|uniref:glycosyltransferase family 2 protein n=1 Tax=Arthrobacter sp. NPDC056691 TaxID=3345913 RepID=UPI00366EAA84
MKKLVAMIASHNRGDLTHRTLMSLSAQVPQGMELFAVLVDCGSTDGTADRCQALGDWVKVVHQSADCYWAEAMSKAEQTAEEMNADFLLWVNDDVDFDAEAVPRLFDVYSSLADKAASVVVGSMQDRRGGVSYGGIAFGSRISKWKPITPTTTPITADAANGNFLLCTSAFARRVGGIDGAFGHSFADFDWTLRARKVGGRIVVAPGFFGVCDRNSLTGTYRDSGLKAREQWRRILSPKGLPPAANARFLSRHGGKLWPLIWAKPYLQILTRMIAGK